jgi:hypothetical protein
MPHGMHPLIPRGPFLTFTIIFALPDNKYTANHHNLDKRPPRYGLWRYTRNPPKCLINLTRITKAFKMFSRA